MTKVKKLAFATAVMGLSMMLAVSCSNNETPGEESKEHAEEMNDETLTKDGEQDADRMVELTEANMLEVQASQDAASRATTADVKKIANMMVEAHTKMGEDMKQLASAKGITLPTGLTNEKMNDLEKLREKSGLDYDKEYLDMMKNAHEDVLRKLENTAEKTEDAEVRDFANKSIPEIRSHLDMVEATRNSIKDMKSDARQADHNNNNNNKKVAADHNEHDGHNH